MGGLLFGGSHENQSILRRGGPQENGVRVRTVRSVYFPFSTLFSMPQFRAHIDLGTSFFEYKFAEDFCSVCGLVDSLYIEIQRPPTSQEKSCFPMARARTS